MTASYRRRAAPTGLITSLDRREVRRAAAWACRYVWHKAESAACTMRDRLPSGRERRGQTADRCARACACWSTERISKQRLKDRRWGRRQRTELGAPQRFTQEESQ